MYSQEHFPLCDVVYHTNKLNSQYYIKIHKDIVTFFLSDNNVSSLESCALAVSKSLRSSSLKCMLPSTLFHQGTCEPSCLSLQETWAAVSISSPFRALTIMQVHLLWSLNLRVNKFNLI